MTEIRKLSFDPRLPANPTPSVDYLTRQNIRLTELLREQSNTINRIIDEMGIVTLADGPQLDAFGRLRVSDANTLFDAQQEYGLDTLRTWDATANGAIAALSSNGSVSSGGNSVGPVDANTRFTPITVSTTDTHYAILQSKQYVRYIPGKSALDFITGVFQPTNTTNVTARFGRFDSANGVFFEIANGTPRFVLRSSTSGSVVDNAVAITDWNIDKLDGRGPSRKVVDFTKVQILVIEAQMLYSGRVLLGFDIDGEIIECHEFLIANEQSSPTLQTYNLPIRAELRNTGTSSGATVYFECCSSQSEGGTEMRGFAWSASNGTTPIAVTTRRPVLSIRPKATFNSRTNRGHIELLDFIFYVTTNNAYFEVVVGGTLTAGGGAPAWISAGTDSITEYNINADAISGGVSIRKGFATSGVGVAAGEFGAIIDFRNPLTLSQIDALTATQTPVSLVATSFTGTSNLSAALNWHEQVI